MPTTMLSPSASAAKASALAAESMSASLCTTTGKRSAIVAAQTMTSRPDSLTVPKRTISRFCRRGAAEETGRREDEHQDQDRENDHIGPAHGDQLTAQRFDQPDQYAAHHRAGDAADATQHGRREGSQPGGVADQETGEIVIETKDQPGGAG